MSDATTVTDPAAPAAAAPKKKKRTVNRTPQIMLLCSIERDETGEIVSFKPVAQPTLAGDTARRDDYKRAVRKTLEEAPSPEVVADYNNKQLVVVSFPPPFVFSATVEEQVVRKTVISES